MFLCITGEEAVFAVVPPATVTLLSCSMRNNMAIGSATEAALGGVIYFDGSGTASIERSHLLGNSVMGPDAEGYVLVIYLVCAALARKKNFLGLSSLLRCY